MIEAPQSPGLRADRGCHVTVQPARSVGAVALRGQQALVGEGVDQRRSREAARLEGLPIKRRHDGRRRTRQGIRGDVADEGGDQGGQFRLRRRAERLHRLVGGLAHSGRKAASKRSMPSLRPSSVW